MAEMERLRLLLTDGREFSIEAESYELNEQSPKGIMSIFRVGGRKVCVVLGGTLAAVIREDALKGEVSPPKSLMPDAAVQPSGIGNGKRTGRA